MQRQLYIRDTKGRDILDELKDILEEVEAGNIDKVEIAREA